MKDIDWPSLHEQRRQLLNIEAGKNYGAYDAIPQEELLEEAIDEGYPHGIARKYLRKDDQMTSSTSNGARMVKPVDGAKDDIEVTPEQTEPTDESADTTVSSTNHSNVSGTASDTAIAVDMGAPNDGEYSDERIEDPVEMQTADEEPSDPFSGDSDGGFDWNTTVEDESKPEPAEADTLHQEPSETEVQQATEEEQEQSPLSDLFEGGTETNTQADESVSDTDTRVFTTEQKSHGSGIENAETPVEQPTTQEETGDDIEERQTSVKVSPEDGDFNGYQSLADDGYTTESVVVSPSRKETSASSLHDIASDTSPAEGNHENHQSSEPSADSLDSDEGPFDAIEAGDDPFMNPEQADEVTASANQGREASQESNTGPATEESTTVEPQTPPEPPMADGSSEEELQDPFEQIDNLDQDSVTDNTANSEAEPPQEQPDSSRREADESASSQVFSADEMENGEPPRAADENSTTMEGPGVFSADDMDQRELNSEPTTIFSPLLTSGYAKRAGKSIGGLYQFTQSITKAILSAGVAASMFIGAGMFLYIIWFFITSWNTASAATLAVHGLVALAISSLAIMTHAVAGDE